MSKKKSSFRDKVARSRENDKKRASSYGYLKLPKGVSVLKLEDRKYSLDFMPYLVSDKNHMDRDDDEGVATVGEQWYRKPFKMHRNVGPNNDNVICLSTIGKKCPICEYRDQRRAEDADDEELKALRPKSRYLYLVIPIGHKKLEEEVMVWDMSWSLFQKLLDEELEDDPDNGIFPDLEDGLTLEIRFSEEKLGKNKFMEASRIKFVERDSVYDESMLEDVPNLDDLLTILPYEELQAKFMDFEAEDTTDGDGFSEVDDDDPVEDKKKRKKKNVKPADKDDTVKDKKDRKKPTRNKKKCPHGHTFGEDFERHDECDDCELVDACQDAS